MYDFLKYRGVCALFSLAIFATFIGAFVYKYQTRGYAFSYSVDYTGGTQIKLRFAQPVSAEELKNLLAKQGLSSPVTRSFSPTELLVRVAEFSDDSEGLALKIKDGLEKELNSPVEILQTDSVGAGIGSALRWQSFMTIFLSLVLMLLYIGIRFWSFSYAIGAIVALFHDALVILLFFLLTDKEISINVIGAILAVLGYSVNDTIVIFSRIRDELKGKTTKHIDDLVNYCLNATLRRTILTSFSTALVTVSLITLGGETLRDLSLALLIGIVFGTYSSIYIASPIMLLLRKVA